jgi:hypothetical protein
VSVRLTCAVPADEADLRAFARRAVMPGRMQVAYCREPDYFHGREVEGRSGEVVIGRDEQTGAIAGLGARSVKEMYLNGRRERLGYLSGLRVAPEFRRRTWLARGYRKLRELHHADPVPFYLTTIMRDNAGARDALTSERAGLPRYQPHGGFEVLLLRPDRLRMISTRSGIAVRRGSADDLSAISEFLAAHGPSRQFYPAYQLEDLASQTGLLRGLAAEDLLVARRGERLAGVLGLWNQAAFRQHRVVGDGPWLRRLRPVLNALARWRGLPDLPAIGCEAGLVNLALNCVAENDLDVWRTLLRAVPDHLVGPERIVAAGLHERDPLLPTLLELPHLTYSSDLYLAGWEDSREPMTSVDGRVPYLELGSL